MRRLLTYVFILAAAIAVTAQAADDTVDALSAAYTHLIEGDYAEAETLAAPLAEAGDADAQHLIGYLYEKGLSVERDTVRALEFYQRAAAQGQSDSQFALGELAFTGDGVVQDFAAAASWYRLAAVRGHPRAKLRLGVLYAEGLGVEQDKKRAHDFFEQAAAAGAAGGHYNLGVASMNGDGVKRNYAAAADAFEQAATQGHLLAQYNLALLHQSGRLGAHDPEKARRWMLAAANGGQPAAMVAMGLMTHARRATVEPDIGEKSASDWFERAALAGDAQGQFLFAVALTEGDGRDKDADEALRWLGFALEEGSGLTQTMRRDAEALQQRLEKASDRRR